MPRRPRRFSLRHRGAAALALWAGLLVALVGASPTYAASISGVVTGNGAPLSGAYVQAYNTNGTAAGAPSSPTDILGHYTLSGLPDGTYKIRFAAPYDGKGGWAAELYDNTYEWASAKTVSVSGTLTGIDADLVIGTGFRGRLVDESGNPVSRGEAAAFASSTGVGIRTGTDGRFHFEGYKPGTYQFLFKDLDGNLVSEYFDNAPSASTATPVTLQAGTLHDFGDITLAPASSVSGRITDDRGLPVSGAQIIVSPAGVGGSGSSTTTGADGRYRVGGLVGGSYRVWIIPPWNNSGGFYRPGTVDVNSGSNVDNIDAVAARGITVRGKVAVPGGGSASGFRVELVPASGGGTPAGSFGFISAASTGADGTYTVAGAPPGTYHVHFTDRWVGTALATDYADGWWNGSTTLGGATTISGGNGDEITGIDHTMVAGRKISGRIADASGDARGGGGSVVLFDDDGYVAQTWVKNDGSYEFVRVPPGEFRVGATVPGRSGSELDVRAYFGGAATLAAATKVSTAAGSRSGIDITIDHFGVIAGGVDLPPAVEPDPTQPAPNPTGPNPFDGVIVTARHSDGREFSTYTYRGSSYRVTGLPPGTYRVCATAVYGEDTRCFGGVDVDAATPVPLAADATVEKIDIDLPDPPDPTTPGTTPGTTPATTPPTTPGTTPGTTPPTTPGTTPGTTPPTTPGTTPGTTPATTPGTTPGPTYPTTPPTTPGTTPGPTYPTTPPTTPGTTPGPTYPTTPPTTPGTTPPTPPGPTYPTTPPTTPIPTPGTTPPTTPATSPFPTTPATTPEPTKPVEKDPPVKTPDTKPTDKDTPPTEKGTPPTPPADPVVQSLPPGVPQSAPGLKPARIVVTLSKKTTVKGGGFTLPGTCKPGELCSGRVTVSATTKKGKKKVTTIIAQLDVAPAAQTRTLTLQLNGAGKKLLGGVGAKGLKVSVTVAGPSAVEAPASFTTTLVSPKKKSK